MTTRKSKSKSKSKGNSHRHGRTKRGGFFDTLKSWFGNNSNPNETNEPAPSKKEFDWFGLFGLRDKLQPPPIPPGNPGPLILGKPQPPQPQQQDMPDAVQDSTTASQASQAAASTPVKGGSRLRVRTKKRSCRCKRK
jgi:hypothetical protein